MKIIILLCVASVYSFNPIYLKNESVKPHDLEDVIREKLEALRASVTGVIFAAFDHLDLMGREVYRARDENLYRAEAIIDEEKLELLSQINNIKNLAQAAGANIDVCLVDYVSTLDELENRIKVILRDCMSFSYFEVAIIQRDCKYRLDILINEVNIYEFQLEVCAGEFLCLERLHEEIELAMTKIPQKVGVQIQAASDLHEQLKLDIRQCNDDKIAQFSMEGGIVVKEITECANDIMS